jgi:hypothetical protein
MILKKQDDSRALLQLQRHRLKSSQERQQPQDDSQLMGSSQEAPTIPMNSRLCQKVCSFACTAGQSHMSAVSESVFSGRTGRSTKTESTWSSVESTTSGRIVQPLSPNSFVTQSTEVTISPRDSVKAVEQLATVVRISSAGTIPVHVHESPTKK